MWNSLINSFKLEWTKNDLLMAFWPFQTKKVSFWRPYCKLYKFYLQKNYVFTCYILFAIIFFCENNIEKMTIRFLPGDVSWPPLPCEPLGTLYENPKIQVKITYAHIEYDQYCGLDKLHIFPGSIPTGGFQDCWKVSDLRNIFIQ